MNYEQDGVLVQALPSVPDLGDRIALFKRATVNPQGFQELLNQYSPDIIHFHDITVNQGLSHLEIAKALNYPTILTVHTPSVSCSQHGLLYRSQTVCDGTIQIGRCSECRLAGAGLPPFIASILSNCSLPQINPRTSNVIGRSLTTRRMTQLFYESFQTLINQIDIIHVLADWNREILLRNGVPDDKLFLVRTGGPHPIKPIVPPPENDSILRIVCIGRSTRIKGIHVLLEAIQSLPQSLPVKVTLFQPTKAWEEKDYGKYVQSMLDRDNRFEVIYGLSNLDLLSQLTTFDLCVVPSLWLETGPLTVLEAFAAGVPVLGSRLGGIAELVTHGIDGYLFEPGYAQELAQYILQLVEKPEQLKKLKENVKPPRTMEVVAQEMTRLYNIAIHKNITDNGSSI
jgi:glycosyltransferase involved in cell wall biosynthesis